jgi:hypothetical protein
MEEMINSVCMKVNEELGLLLRDVTQLEEQDFLFVLNSPFSGDIIADTIRMIEKNVRMAGYSQQVVTRVKMISIEILQNIQKHQVVTPGFNPYFVISSHAQELRIYSGNVVSDEVKLKIGERLQVYQSIDPSVMKTFYMESLKNTQVNHNSNASIGLLDIVYRSNQNINYHFKPIENNLSFFGLTVFLEANKN